MQVVNLTTPLILRKCAATLAEVLAVPVLVWPRLARGIHIMQLSVLLLVLLQDRCCCPWGICRCKIILVSNSFQREPQRFLHTSQCQVKLHIIQACNTWDKTVAQKDAMHIVTVRSILMHYWHADMMKGCADAESDCRLCTVRARGVQLHICSLPRHIYMLRHLQL